MPDTAVTSEALPRLVRRTREQLTAVVRETDPQAADRVEAVATREGPTPSVVVVGDANRGKSSLINALLATPDLSPVDAGAATGTYVIFGYGDRAVGRACYPGRREPVRFETTALRAWTSAAGELPEGELPPRYVEVDVPVPLLQRFRLVDTPGAGGLDALHAELALEATAQATALLFVADASAPFTDSEVRFLHRVSEGVETVVFVLAKTDAFQGWREVLDADRALLAEHAPRFCDAPFLPVSARLFERAGGLSRQAAMLLRERSGVAGLQVVLQELVTGRAAMLTEANALRALSGALDERHAALEAERRALSGSEAEIHALRDRRAGLAAQRRASGRGWHAALRGQVQRARLESNHDVARRVRDLQSWFRQAIDGADRDRLARLPGEVDAALGLVSGRINADLARRLSAMADATLAELFTPQELRMLRAQLARGAWQPVVLRPPERRQSTPEDKLLVLMGMSGGFGAARIAALPLAGVVGVGVLNPFVLPATIVIGLGAGAWMARTRRHSAQKQHTKQWLTDAIADVSATIDHVVSEQLIEAERQLALAMDDALGRRIEAIDAELEKLDSMVRLRADERAARLAEVERRISAVSTGLSRVAELLRNIRALRDRPTGPLAGGTESA